MGNRSRLTVVLAAACIGYIACGADGDKSENRGALAELNSGQLAEYDRVISELGDKTGIEPLLPAYLPLGTAWKPETEDGLRKNEAVMTFYRGRSDTPVSERPVIRITQASDPDERICPPCADLDEGDLERWDAQGTTVLADVGQAGPGRVFASIYFRASGLRVEVDFDWDMAPEKPATITDDMKTEALKVVGSMLEQPG
jgi:hypothetical protein